MMVRIAVCLAAALVLPRVAAAVPGPDSVVVVANANISESVTLADQYREARQIPGRQVCLLDLPEADDLSLDEFRTRLLEPLRECLGDIEERIEAAVLVRGVPLRVTVHEGERVSTAAALGTWKSELDDGTPLLGTAPGTAQDCGGATCYAARIANPFTSGAFEPGWEKTSRGITFRPLLVTMLHGRTYEEAAKLIDSAVAGDSLGGARGQFLFMEGADAPRGALDGQYDEVIERLRERGFTDVVREEFDGELSGRELAGFVTGSSSLGNVIEGNTFAPGALVDNLTSLGALPVNFTDDEAQVSVSRWIAMGVTGVHGTTDEPLNNCFPHRRFLSDWVDGYTLAEAYFRRLPFTYWRNLVLGDPMAAAYATRPEVRAELANCRNDDGTRTLHVEVADPAERGTPAVAVYADGLPLFAGEGSVDVALDDGESVELLVVAQAAEGVRSKGWATVQLEPAPALALCSQGEGGSGGTPNGEGGAGGAGGAGGGGAGGGGAAPPPQKRGDSGGGCSTTAGGAAGGSLLALHLLATRRRR